ncbi:hypothetical protein ACEPPU_24255 [Priestia aryabhattai]|uniref:hypothetical protein n=1 Tax=Priestia aryabhattai TaxID=412384 RepID=UPI0035AC1892
MKKKEIFADCYAESIGSLEVYVNKEECPKPKHVRSVADFQADELKEQAVCHCMVGLTDLFPPCPYFEKIKQVQRNKERKFKVFCKAIEVK